MSVDQFGLEKGKKYGGCSGRVKRVSVRPLYFNRDIIKMLPIQLLRMWLKPIKFSYRQGRNDLKAIKIF